MKLNVPPYIKDIKPYVPGKPIEEVEREYKISGSVKLASNENPLGPSPMAVKALTDSLSKLNRYPDGSGYYLKKKISKKLNIVPDSVVLGSGSDEIIGMLARAFLTPEDEVLMISPSFLMYEIMTRISGARPVFVPLNGLDIDLDAMADAVTPSTRMIFITNPNNPTGAMVKHDRLKSFLDRVPQDIILVIDEAYIEFVRDKSCANGLFLCTGDRPVVVLRTFSKAYGLAGLRIGYGVMPPEIAGILDRVRQPFNTSLPAQAAAAAALDDNLFLDRTLRLVHEEIDFMRAELKRGEEISFPTQANFFLVDVRTDANLFFTEMLKHGVIIRSMVSYGFPEYIRVSAGLRDENLKFLEAFKKVATKLQCKNNAGENI
ncbi:MAG: histidinol-phosphate transaminase [Deltaproteobacteria bacterium]|nr:histidinol-phosphate transaminase [Deltaproteobacteria bacterium]